LGGKPKEERPDGAEENEKGPAGSRNEQHAASRMLKKIKES
jgi:hypothetical protein